MILIRITNLLSNITDFSQANHMDQLHAMAKQGESELNGFIRDHGSYNNSYLEEGT